MLARNPLGFTTSPPCRFRPKPFSPVLEAAPLVLAFWLVWFEVIGYNDMELGGGDSNSLPVHAPRHPHTRTLTELSCQPSIFSSEWNRQGMTALHGSGSSSPPTHARPHGRRYSSTHVPSPTPLPTYIHLHPLIFLPHLSTNPSPPIDQPTRIHMAPGDDTYVVSPPDWIVWY